MSAKVWNLMFYVGNTGRLSHDTANPMTRAQALKAACGVLASNRWRAWVEHYKTGVRIWESDAEKASRRPPEPSGPGLREIQQIQNERMDKWTANQLPVKFSPSLQEAKDAAKGSAAADAKPTCGDCRYFPETTGDDNIPCLVPLPFWVSPRSNYWPWRGDERAGDCRCFERKEAK